jgi:hypothetical protein
MAGIVASYSALNRMSLSPGLAEYWVSREINGETRILLIYFVRDADGVWRLESM